MREELELKQLREDMIDMLVHDLRAPISIVTTTLQMLPDIYYERDDERFEQLVGISRRTGDRVQHLIKDILTISQLENRQLPMKPEAVPVSDLFYEIASHFNPIAANNQVQLITEIAEDLPPLHVDRSLVLRVLYNLTDNALKFTHNEGSVNISASISTHADSANASNDYLASRSPTFIEITVKDTGPGIPEEEMHRVFEKFQQVSSVRGRKRGTGLGLPFCKLVVEEHGGAIRVKSEVDKGSVFHLTLPTGHVTAEGTKL
jgi:signal transduction histidine kinase